MNPIGLRSLQIAPINCGGSSAKRGRPRLYFDYFYSARIITWYVGDKAYKVGNRGLPYDTRFPIGFPGI